MAEREREEKRKRMLSQAEIDCFIVFIELDGETFRLVQLYIPCGLVCSLLERKTTCSQKASIDRSSLRIENTLLHKRFIQKERTIRRYLRLNFHRDILFRCSMRVSCSIGRQG